MCMACVLVTGFQPFGGELVNPSWEAVRLLPSTIANTRIETLEVPVVFGDSGDVVVEAMRSLGPAVVICVAGAVVRSRYNEKKVFDVIGTSAAKKN